VSTDKSKTANTPLTYRDAGVDINAGNELVERIKPIAKATSRPEVMAGLGGFGAMFELPLDRYKQPVLVSGTDGVGTKLRLAMMMGKHDTIGIDLVAMCVNDLLVQGAEPLFFLDYYATGKLDVDTAASVVEGIGEGCRQAGAALIGGETAEMPGMYEGEDYDLAGFCVGIVEKNRIIDGSKVAAGDDIIGIASSGPHSNGYSLIRKILERSGANLDSPLDQSTLGDCLLAPTRIYVESILKLISQIDVHGLCHITGGGLLENLPRVMSEHCQAVINTQSWAEPVIFGWLREQGQVPHDDMYRTFNCGIGMVVTCATSDTERTLEILTDAGEDAWCIGQVISQDDKTPSVQIN